MALTVDNTTSTTTVASSSTLSSSSTVTMSEFDKYMQPGHRLNRRIAAAANLDVAEEAARHMSTGTHDKGEGGGRVLKVTRRGKETKKMVVKYSSGSFHTYMADRIGRFEIVDVKS